MKNYRSVHQPGSCPKGVKKSDLVLFFSLQVKHNSWNYFLYCKNLFYICMVLYALFASKSIISFQTLKSYEVGKETINLILQTKQEKPTEPNHVSCGHIAHKWQKVKYKISDSRSQALSTTLSMNLSQSFPLFRNLISSVRCETFITF